MLNLGPVGLGHLLTANYLPDARTYYCPSSDGMIGDPNGFDAAGKGQHNNTGYRLGHWQLAGGFDADTLHYGNWWGPVGYLGASNQYERIIWSHYNYRNVPLESHSGYCVYNEIERIVNVPYTKPYVTVSMCGPAFRTTKILGNRSLVCDTFSKGALGTTTGWDGLDRLKPPQSTLAGTASYPGMAISGHRDGYNVLYGDWHAKWYGDPQQRIMWHRESGYYTYVCNGWTNTLSANCYYARDGGGGFTVYTNPGDYFWTSPNAIWHYFDVDAGVDNF
jgi:prepilin-type processing-associated H-X9-DG protein